MQGGVRVTSVQALEDFALRYRRFIEEVISVLILVDENVWREREELERRCRLQLGRVAELTRRSEQAAEDERDFWEDQLTKARAHLVTMRACAQRLRDRHEAYRQLAERARQLAQEQGPKAVARLEQLSESLRAYVTTAPPGERVAEVTPHQPQSTIEVPRERCAVCRGTGWVRTGPRNPEHFESRERFEGGPDVWEPCPRCGMRSATGDVANREFAHEPPATAIGLDLTKYAMPAGYHWIPLEEIRQEEVLSKNEFRKVDRATMVRGMAALPVVLEQMQGRLALGRAEISSYFRRLDRQAGRSYEEGLQRVYDAFFGNDDHIRLSRFRGDPFWAITNGRHRIQIARELGWRAIPAVAEEVDHRGAQ